MDLMVNPVITDFQQDVNGDIKMLKLGANKEDAWANIAEQGGSAKLDNNKTATINVSTYTEPVVITPTSGKDGMKKATITLSNIPSGVSTLYCWKYENQSSVDYLYTLIATPSTGDTCIQNGESGSGEPITVHTVGGYSGGKVLFDTHEYNRYSDGDIEYNHTGEDSEDMG